MHKLCNINVLGTEYTVEERERKEDKRLKYADGYCDYTIRKCVVRNIEPDRNSLGDLEAYKRRVIRHELIHAFLTESGLDCESAWAVNEEMVDWLAHQFPKLLEAFKKAGAI